MLITPVTELDAVNEIISSIGESPVNTTENPMNVDVINAIRILNIENRKFQARGWSFNMISPYKLNPDFFTQRIHWTDSFLYLKGTDGSRYTKRGEYVYNFTNQTDVFKSPIEVECILLVPFVDMPEQARHYITCRASKAFQVRYLGDITLTEVLTQSEMESWRDLQEYELEMNDYNMLDNIGVQQLRRR